MASAMVTEPTPTKPTLRARLSRHILPPLVLTWALGSVIAIWLANGFVSQAFDRALLDDALAIAARIEEKDGQPKLALSQSEMASLLFDQSESVYFVLVDGLERFIAGHPALIGTRPKIAESSGAKSSEFYDSVYQGKVVRAVVLSHAKPVAYTLVVAQTTHARQTLLRDVVIWSLIPQSLLLIVLMLWVRRAMQSDLAPISTLQAALSERDTTDLSPIGMNAPNRDVQVLADTADALLVRVANGISAHKEFMGNVAHELKTPIAGIRALAEFGLQQKDPAMWREQLQSVQERAQRASHVIDQLLALAFADEADTSFVQNSVRLDSIVLDCVSRVAELPANAHVEFSAEGLEADCWVLGHVQLVEGILNNLLDNTLRYGKPADRSVQSIDVFVVRQADATLLRVSDNGPGLDESALKAIRERWVQGDVGRDMGLGSGLGLAIIGRYTQLIGASWGLDSSQKATQFWVRFKSGSPPAN